MNPVLQRRRSILAAGFLLFLCASHAAASGSSLHGRFRSLVQARDLKTTSVAICVMDLDRGETLVSLGAEKPMIPASNMKLLTTAAALSTLGPAFTFRTTLSALEGEDADDGTTLLLVGDGDPALVDPRGMDEGDDVEVVLHRWVEAVQRGGVKRVGTLIVDDRVFDRQWAHPDWPRDQLNRWYCAEVAGINFHQNCLGVYPQPTAVGQSPTITLVPDAPFMAGGIRNRAVTGDADTFWISRKHATNRITFMGKVRHRRRDPVWVTFHDPPLVAGQLLADRLRRAGIAVDQVKRAGEEDQFDDTRVLAQWLTPLPEVVRRCNKHSQNLFAEAMMKRMGRHVTGSPGTWATGGAAMRMFLSRTLGADAALVHVADGSGMSRENRVTARAIVDLLDAMHRDAVAGPVFRDSLAIAGVDGTLKKRLQGKLRGEVYGKSGFINRVCTLSGYLVIRAAPGERAPDESTPAPRTIAFSLLFNDFKAPVYLHTIKNLQDDLIRMMDETLAPHLVQTDLGG